MDTLKEHTRWAAMMLSTVPTAVIAGIGEDLVPVGYYVEFAMNISRCDETRELELAIRYLSDRLLWDERASRGGFDALVDASLATFSEQWGLLDEKQLMAVVVLGESTTKGPLRYFAQAILDDQARQRRDIGNSSSFNFDVVRIAQEIVNVVYGDPAIDLDELTQICHDIMGGGHIGTRNLGIGGDRQ